MNNRGKNVVVPVVVLLATTFWLCIGYAVWSRVFVHVQGPAVADAAAASLSTSAGAASVPRYPAEVVGYDETGTRVQHFLQKADYVFNAFGGELLGADRGEWGGELVFRDANGSVHPLLKRNVRGIVRMPYGIIVFTGLAHMGRSTGAIFRIAKRNDGAVVATWLHALRGTPGDVRWTTHGDLVFSVRYMSRDGLFRGAHTQCLLLDRSGSLRRQLCMAIMSG